LKSTFTSYEDDISYGIKLEREYEKYKLNQEH